MTETTFSFYIRVGNGAQSSILNKYITFSFVWQALEIFSDNTVHRSKRSKKLFELKQMRVFRKTTISIFEHLVFTSGTRIPQRKYTVHWSHKPLCGLRGVSSKVTFKSLPWLLAHYRAEEN